MLSLSFSSRHAFALSNKMLSAFSDGLPSPKLPHGNHLHFTLLALSLHLVGWVAVRKAWWVSVTVNDKSRAKDNHTERLLDIIISVRERRAMNKALLKGFLLLGDVVTERNKPIYLTYTCSIVSMFNQKKLWISLCYISTVC